MLRSVKTLCLVRTFTVGCYTLTEFVFHICPIYSQPAFQILAILCQRKFNWQCAVTYTGEIKNDYNYQRISSDEMHVYCISARVCSLSAMREIFCLIVFVLFYLGILLAIWKNVIDINTFDLSNRNQLCCNTIVP